MSWDKESIQALLDSNAQAVASAIVAIQALQSADERAEGATLHANGVGYSRHDAEFMGSLAAQIQRGRTLSPKQLAAGRASIKRYWRQLVILANAELEHGAPAPALCPAIAPDAGAALIGAPISGQRVGIYEHGAF